jgi:vancomycin permeability regulator SanA
LEADGIVVIFGAKVRPDGTPSGAVSRRVAAALKIASGSSPLLFLVTGASRLGGPSEAGVMQRMLTLAGIPPNRIVVDEASADTLASVVRCAALIRERCPRGRVVVCSDRYHIPRCRWLFFLLGIHTSAAAIESGREANGTLRWAYWFLREIPAIPWDTLLLLMRRGRTNIR